MQRTVELSGKHRPPSADPAALSLPPRRRTSTPPPGPRTVPPERGPDASPIIRSHAAPFFIAEALASDRVSATRVLAEHGIAASRNDEPVELSVGTFHHLCDALASACNLPFLGLDVATRIPRGTYGLLEFTLRNAPTLFSALEVFSTLAPLVKEAGLVQVEPIAGGARITEHVAVGPAGRQVGELAMALWVRIVREILGDASWAPDRVCFMHARPETIEPLVAFLGTARLAFDARSNALDIDEPSLSRRVHGADPALYRLLATQATNELRSLPTDLPSRVLAVIRPLLAERIPGIAEVASTLGVSSRSLQRRLAERGRSFLGLVDEARREVAERHLRDRSRTASEVAALAGFSDVRAFTRAFRRWTGTTPTAWRRGEAS